MRTHAQAGGPFAKIGQWIAREWLRLSHGNFGEVLPAFMSRSRPPYPAAADRHDRLRTDRLTLPADVEVPDRRTTPWIGATGNVLEVLGAADSCLPFGMRRPHGDHAGFEAKGSGDSVDVARWESAPKPIDFRIQQDGEPGAFANVHDRQHSRMSARLANGHCCLATNTWAEAPTSNPEAAAPSRLEQKYVGDPPPPDLRSIARIQGMTLCTCCTPIDSIQ